MSPLFWAGHREVELRVADLHSLSPTELLTVSGASLHALTLQQARHYNIAPGADAGGVYLCAAPAALFVFLSSSRTQTVENRRNDRHRVGLAGSLDRAHTGFMFQMVNVELEPPRLNGFGAPQYWTARFCFSLCAA